MSLLLDALDRADKERSQQFITPSSPVTPTVPEANEYRVKRWVLEVSIGFFLLILVLYALFFRSSIEVVDPVAATNTIGSLPASESLKLEGFPNENFPKEALQKQETQIAAVLQQEAIHLEAPKEFLVEEDDSAVPKSDNIISKLYQQQNSRELLIENEPIQSTPPPTLSPTMEAIPDNPTFAEDKIAQTKEVFFQEVPLLSDMPTQFKRGVPSLKYSTHVYSKGAQSGFVNINGPFREVGSQIAPGLKLIAILPEAVVLELDGVLFRLRALRDWEGY